ncbi:hypothetical protein NDU88_005818 [Pleurodeles waltl]|uniref:Uncharacterized protein n=1 Tax=Pleurodeles waltl TaxID=8319 RepID=A0AAV7VPL9_PLEWA|nr:hypothetical protein NDU88_005818 [Pleurodeles waltl]
MYLVCGKNNPARAVCVENNPARVYASKTARHGEARRKSQPRDGPKVPRRWLRSLSLRQRCCASFLLLRASILRSRFLRRRFSAAEPASRRFLSRDRIRVDLFSARRSVRVFLSLGCQPLLSGSQELEGHHRAE